MAILELLLVVTAMTITSSSAVESNLRNEKIRSHLKRLNKPAVKSINSPDGDIIDCVLMTHQPAFDHPLLRNHTIQMRPSSYPEGVSTSNEIPSKGITQLWHMNGKCPENTVPIRRTKKEDLLRADSIDDYGRKIHTNFHKPQLNNHEHAVLRDTTGNFHGTKATINIWKPEVEVPSEFSLAQLWVTAGNYQNYDLNSIEVGWQVYPNMYGDNNPRLFVYWTRDAYQNTGCYNLKCPGFVQTNNEIVIGGSFSSTSSYNGSQYVITIVVWKDPQTGNWWLQINDKNVGYWPRGLHTKLAEAGERVEWGGEVMNLRVTGQHTSTQMGSGHFGDEGYGKASYFKNIQVIDASNNLRDPNPQGLQVITLYQNCYNLRIGGGGTSSGTNFYFGGPGRNANCP